MKFIAFKLVFIALGLAGCGSMVGAHSSCSQSNSGYEATWNCIKGRIASGTAGMTNNSQTIRYVAAGDALSEQVRSGRMTDLQAKAVLAAELEQGEASFNRARANNSPTVCNFVGNTMICN
jgi:hypothetical protein